MTEALPQQHENTTNIAMHPEQIPVDGYMIPVDHELLVRGLSNDHLAAYRENVSFVSGDLEIIGIPSLVVQFSAEKPYAEAIVLDVRQQHLVGQTDPEAQGVMSHPIGFRNGKPFNSRADYMLVLRAYPERAYGSSRQEAIEMRPFVVGESLTIGRRREKGVMGTRVLPETASRDYCTLMIDEAGDLSIKNREQIDATTVYLPENAPDIRETRVGDRFKRFMQRVGQRLVERTIASSDRFRVPMEAILSSTADPVKKPGETPTKKVAKTVSEIDKENVKVREDALQTLSDILETKAYSSGGKGINYQLALEENPNLVHLAAHAVRKGALSQPHPIKILRAAGWSEERISNLLYPHMLDPTSPPETAQRRRRQAVRRVQPDSDILALQNRAQIHIANKSGTIVRTVSVDRDL